MIFWWFWDQLIVFVYLVWHVLDLVRIWVACGSGRANRVCSNPGIRGFDSICNNTSCMYMKNVWVQASSC